MQFQIVFSVSLATFWLLFATFGEVLVKGLPDFGLPLITDLNCLIPEERVIRLTAMLDAFSNCIFSKFDYFLALFTTFGVDLVKGLPEFGLPNTTDLN